MTTDTLMLDIYILKHKNTNCNILKKICNDLEYNYEKIISRSRKREIVIKRQLIQYILYKKNMTRMDTGQLFGYDHTTIIHSIKKVNNYLYCKDEHFMTILDKLPTFYKNLVL